MSTDALLRKLRRQVQELAEIVSAHRRDKALLEKKILSLQEEVEALHARLARAEGPENPSVEKSTVAPTPLPRRKSPPGTDKGPEE
jgi:hypothetical protein